MEEFLLLKKLSVHAMNSIICTWVALFGLTNRLTFSVFLCFLLLFAFFGWGGEFIKILSIFIFKFEISRKGQIFFILFLLERERERISMNTKTSGFCALVEE